MQSLIETKWVKFGDPPKRARQLAAAHPLRNTAVEQWISSGVPWITNILHTIYGWAAKCLSILKAFKNNTFLIIQNFFLQKQCAESSEK